MSSRAAPGWYHAEGDPPGTIRFWNGSEWVGEPRPSAAPRPEVHGRSVADPGRRILAAIIDGLILSVFALPAVISAMRDIDWDAVATGAVVPEFTVDPGWVLATAVLSFLYTVGSVAVWGATPGKRLMRIEIIRQSDGGTPPGWMTAFVRHLPTLAVGVISQVVFLVSPPLATGVSNLGIVVQLASLVLVFSDRTRRSVYDMVARTNVVDRLG